MLFYSARVVLSAILLLFNIVVAVLNDFVAKEEFKYIPYKLGREVRKLLCSFLPSLAKPKLS